MGFWGSVLLCLIRRDEARWGLCTAGGLWVGAWFASRTMLQVRVRVIDGHLRDDFARWPGFPSNESPMSWAS